MLEIDKYAYSSRIAGTMPQYKILFGTVPLVSCLLANSAAASILTILIMGWMAVTNTHITWQKYLRLLMLPCGFLILGTITVVFQQFPVGHPVLLGFELYNNVYGMDGNSLAYGANLILRALAAVSCMYFIALTTPLNDIVYAMRRLKVPPLLISLMVLIYRYIFVLLNEVQRMQIAQSSRLGYVDLKTSLKSTGDLLAALFLRTYLRCNNIYAALESRGYSGEFPGWIKSYDRSGKMVVATLLYGCVLIGTVILERKIF